MKKLLFFTTFFFALASAFGQPDYTPGVPHKNAAPTWTPSTYGGKIAWDYSNKRLYYHVSGSTWALLANPATSPTAVGTANQIWGMNSGATAGEWKTVSGTTNRVTVTHSAGGITLNTPQNTHTSATPTFGGLTLSNSTNALFELSNSTGGSIFLYSLGGGHPYAEVRSVIAPSSVTSPLLKFSNTNATAHVAGGLLGQINFRGSLGSSDIASVDIVGVADGTFSLSSAPGHLIFKTTPSGSTTSLERLRIASTGETQLRSGNALRFYDSDNTNYISFQVPATGTLTADRSYTFPADYGTSGYQLTTDGAGGLSWAAAGSGAGLVDGDYGDITVGGTGTTMEIDAGAVGTSEIATDGVDAAEIAADAVGSAEIAADAVGTSEIATDGVGAAEIAAGVVGTSEIATNAVADTDFRQSVGLSVVGRSANSTGDVADITGTDGQVLRVSGTTLGFGTVATAGIADAAVTMAKINQSSATSGQVITWNGSVWAPATPSGGSSPSVISPSQITADNDDYEPTGWDDATTVRVSFDSDINAITSFDAATDGERKVIRNVGTNFGYIPPTHPDATAGNGVAGSQDFLIAPGGSLEAEYDDTDNLWYVISNTFNPASVPTGRGIYYNQQAGSTNQSDQSFLGLAQSGSGSNGNNASATTPIEGTWSLSRGSTASSNSTLYLIKNNVTYTSFGAGHLSAWTSVHIPTLCTSAQRFQTQLAITNAPSGTTARPNNTIGISAVDNENSGNWTLFSVDNAGGSTTVDSGVAPVAGTVYFLQVFLDKSRTEARYFINGTYVGRITANLPNAVVCGTRVGLFGTVGTSDREIRVSQIGGYVVRN